MQETYCMHTLSTSTVTAAASAAPAATPAAMQQYETAVKTVKVRSSKDSICRTKRVRVAARQQPLLSTPSTFRPCPILAAIIITRSTRILKRRDFACVTCLTARLKLLYAC